MKRGSPVVMSIASLKYFYNSNRSLHVAAPVASPVVMSIASLKYFYNSNRSLHVAAPAF